MPNAFITPCMLQIKSFDATCIENAERVLVFKGLTLYARNNEDVLRATGLPALVSSLKMLKMVFIWPEELERSTHCARAEKSRALHWCPTQWSDQIMAMGMGRGDKNDHILQPLWYWECLSRKIFERSLNLTSITIFNSQTPRKPYASSKVRSIKSISLSCLFLWIWSEHVAQDVYRLQETYLRDSLMSFAWCSIRASKQSIICILPPDPSIAM